MSGRLVMVLVFLPLPFYAQEDDRKPSPFPDENRRREAAAARAKRSEAMRPKGSSSDPQRRSAGAADRSSAAAPAGPNEGKACFFSSKPGGRATAGGAEASSEELVAAHATYALGARVLVTNLANGREVEVKIVDRLPDSRRIISVSEAAARQLGFFEAGIANVRVEAARAAAAPDKP